ncbi:CLUMA_CG007276, isoform A [Clunio marinus]|uniref:CLUMA_CG007276, isoform A n=1 Tax=Clunio marinus TaxID=568069 RepID=A0A1J1I2C7_9DIPT|nr:CLUMA_CG007276, isoform A [Clunio marinus]
MFYVIKSILTTAMVCFLTSQLETLCDFYIFLTKRKKMFSNVSEPSIQLRLFKLFPSQNKQWNKNHIINHNKKSFRLCSSHTLESRLRRNIRSENSFPSPWLSLEWIYEDEFMWTFSIINEMKSFHDEIENRMEKCNDCKYNDMLVLKHA